MAPILLHKLALTTLTVLTFHSYATVASEEAEPTVMIAMLVRNKEPYLPYTLTQLSELDYPKEKLVLWLRSDHNEDNSLQQVTVWLREYGDLYADADVVLNATTPERREDETSAVHKSNIRYAAVIGMKEEALETARRLKVDFVWFLDADVIFHEKSILKTLMEMEKALVAPMLESDSRYSNFWAGMDDNFYYQRTDRYGEIYNREEKSCFAVPMIHSCVLVDLREKLTKSLTFVKTNLPTPIGPDLDDIITFSLSARQAGLEMHVCNHNEYGQVPVPLEPPEELSLEWENIAIIKMKALSYISKLSVAEVLRPFLPPLPERTSLGFDNVYVISLMRRRGRRKRVLAVLNELGFDADVLNAVDGRKLNDSFLLAHNISMLPGYRDPKLDRPLTFGEVGCFLSHHTVWKDMFQKSFQRVLVFEDDVHPPLDLEVKLTEAVAELDRLQPDWDFLYLYREFHFLGSGESQPVEGSDKLLRPGYSYSTLAYALTWRGALKLMRERPLQKLLPVDEFLPIMYGQHPNEEWKKHFPGSGSLKAFAIHPRIVEPYVYRDMGAITDTDLSDIVSVWNSDDEQGCSADPALQEVCE